MAAATRSLHTRESDDANIWADHGTQGRQAARAMPGRFGTSATAHHEPTPPSVRSQRASKRAHRHARRPPPPGSRPKLRKDPEAAIVDGAEVEQTSPAQERVLPTNPALETIADTRGVRERLNANGLPAKQEMGVWMRSVAGEAVGYNQLGTSPRCNGVGTLV